MLVFKDVRCHAQKSRSTLFVQGSLWPISGQQPVYVTQKYQISSLGTSTGVRLKKYQVPGTRYLILVTETQGKNCLRPNNLFFEQGLAKMASVKTHLQTYTHAQTQAKEQSSNQVAVHHQSLHLPPSQRLSELHGGQPATCRMQI